MRLLLITYEMDNASAVLAWQERLASSLAGVNEHVLVLTEKTGAFTRAPNLTVEEFPPAARSRPGKLLRIALANRLTWRLCREHRVEACFIHMAHNWTYLLRPAFALLRMPVVLWYAHGSVTRRLHLALACADLVVTSSPSGFRIPSSKVRIIGQGIDTRLFALRSDRAERNRLVYAGRICRRKGLDKVIAATGAVVRSRPESDIRLRLIGPMLTEDDRYYQKELQERVRALGLEGRVEFTGSVLQKDMPRYYTDAFLHINMSETGSMDKTVLEALACGCPVLTSNEAFLPLLSDRPEMIITDKAPGAVAGQILAAYARRDEQDGCVLRALVQGAHDLASYAGKVMTAIEDARGKRKA